MMFTKDIKVDQSNIRYLIGKKLFFLTFVFWYIMEIFFSSSLKVIFGIQVSYINNVISYVILILLVVEIFFFQTYTLRELVIILFISLPISIATILSDYRILMSAFLFIIASKNIDFDKLVIYARRILVVMISLIIVLNLMGFINDKILYRGGIVRHSLGFSHPNQLGLRIFQLMICYAYLHYDIMKIRGFFLVIASAVLMWIIPNSQSSVVCLSLLAIMMLTKIILTKYSPELIAGFARILILLSIVVNAFSVFMSCINLSNHPALNRIDRLLSVRFSSCNYVLRYYGLTLFGNKIYVSEQERIVAGIKKAMWLDNAYMNILLRYGIIVYMLFSVLYIATMLYFYREKKYNLIMIYTLFAIYGIMEIGIYVTSVNIFILAMAYPLYDPRLPNTIRSKIKLRSVGANSLANRFSR